MTITSRLIICGITLVLAGINVILATLNTESSLVFAVAIIAAVSLLVSTVAQLLAIWHEHKRRQVWHHRL